VPNKTIENKPKVASYLRTFREKGPERRGKGAKKRPATKTLGKKKKGVIWKSLRKNVHTPMSRRDLRQDKQALT